MLDELCLQDLARRRWNAGLGREQLRQRGIAHRAPDKLKARQAEARAKLREHLTHLGNIARIDGTRERSMVRLWMHVVMHASYPTQGVQAEGTDLGSESETPHSPMPERPHNAALKAHLNRVRRGQGLHDPKAELWMRERAADARSAQAGAGSTTRSGRRQGWAGVAAAADMPCRKEIACR